MEERKWMGIAQLAKRNGVGMSTIRKRYREMEETGLFPGAVINNGGIKIDADIYDQFLIWRREQKCKIKK